MEIYIVSVGRRDGSWGTNNEFEEYIVKVFDSKEKAISYIEKEYGETPDEDGYLEICRTHITINDHDDDDYSWVSYDEYDVE